MQFRFHDPVMSVNVGVIKLWCTNAVVGKGEVNEKSGNNYVLP